MSENRWQRVEEIFHSAVELAPEARAKFLDEACGADQSLRREVESLLEHVSEDGSTFAGPVKDDFPQTIAHYRISAKLGEGGMGAVYRATDTKLGREVAIKVLPPAFAHDADRLARFKREALVLASLNHPNIATIYGVEERALIMELVDGKTLSGPLSLDTALNYARQIADALETAHEKGIVHRDLKPANIMITPAGVIKVLDFGLAAVVQDSSPGRGDPANSPTLTKDLTKAGVILGTAGYMAPEQARGMATDGRADIWAFGVVLHEMLTGRRLFQGEDFSTTLAAVMKDEPRWDGIPVKVQRLLKSCLEKDPKRRLRDIGDSWRLLEDAPAPRRLPWAVPCVLALSACLLAAALWRAARPVDHPLLQFSADLGPDSLKGPHTTAVLSPDGTSVVFPSRGPDGQTRLSIRLLSQPMAAPLSGTENGTDPFFSPDRQWIGFFADNKLKKVSVGGGSAVTLADIGAGRGGSWGAEGNIIAATTRGGLFRIPESGGTPQRLTKPGDKGEVTHRWPQLLPGGQSVLFTAHTLPFDWDDASIAILSLKTGQWKTVQRNGYFGRYLPSGHLVYIHKGVLLGSPFDPIRGELKGTPAPLLVEVAANRLTGGGQFDFSQTGTLVYLGGKSSIPSYPIVWLDRAGKTLPVQPAPGDYGMPRLSPDGQRLALVSGGSGAAASDIFVYDLQRADMTKITFGGPSNSRPVWTPGGKHIVYVSHTDAGYNFMWIRADGAGEPQLLMESKEALLPYSFSPDGKRLGYCAISPETGGDIWTLPLDITDPDHPKPGKPEAFLRTPATEFSPAFSPDGRWMAYQAEATTFTTEVYVRPFPGPGGTWQISSDGGSFPVWSRDGRELLYETPDGHIMSAAYTAKGDSFARERVHLWSSQQIRLTGSLPSYDLSADGKRLVVFPLRKAAEETKGSVHVTFLLNFFDELRRKTPVGK